MTHIYIEFRPAGIGRYTPYPFVDMHPGDTMEVCARRCNQSAVYQAILRFKKKYPGRQFTLETQKAEPFSHIVTRIE